MNRKELINDIAQKCVDKMMDFDDFNADWDEDGLSSASIHEHFDYNGCYVDCNYYYEHHYFGNDDETIEILLYPSNDKHHLERLTDAVQKAVEELMDVDDLLESIKDKLREASEDEWTSHGFRDEADYNNYRYR